MAKLLLLVLGIWLIVVLLKRYRGSLDAPRTKPPKPEDMVCCAKCGVYLPKSESVLKRGAYYCCDKHSESTGQ